MKYQRRRLMKIHRIELCLAAAGNDVKVYRNWKRPKPRKLGSRRFCRMRMGRGLPMRTSSPRTSGTVSLGILSDYTDHTLRFPFQPPSQLPYPFFGVLSILKRI